MTRGYRNVIAIAAASGALLSAAAGHAADATAENTGTTNHGPGIFADANAVIVPGIRVVLNHAKIVKLSHPAATVIIGNPEIADATVRDASTLILTGRGFGQTNLVILDEGGNPILDERIAVSRENGSALRIYRQAEIETLSCEPFCEKAYLTEAEVQSIRAIRDANRRRED
ncbi:pilus assembly protein N-terminal domain-containing protein [Oricola sp.]|uniref:pilus assembly protein N-terminal domain-containing protein n=1 Tax=Oricola sp. TaxID=1979950 RepID=UPI003BA8B45E